MLTPKIISVEATPDYTLHVCFADGTKNLFDVKPYIHGSWFGELESKSYFKQVRIIDDGYGIEWPNGQDIAPHELYEQ